MFKEQFFDAEGVAINCAEGVLFLQGNPGLGALLSDRAIEHALSVLPDAVHVRLERAGHDLGLNSWDVGPLLQTVTDFLESL